MRPPKRDTEPHYAAPVEHEVDRHKVTQMSEQPKKTATTMDELDKEIKVLEAAAVQAATPEPAPEAAPTAEAQTKENPAVQPEQTPSPAANADVEALKTQLAESEARVADLTKRMRDEGGKRGGELNTLRGQVQELSDQVRTLVQENRALRTPKPSEPQPPAMPDSPDPLDKYEPEVREGVDRRVKPVSEAAQKATDAASKAEKIAEEAKQEAFRLRQERMFDRIRAAVPNFTELYDKEEFQAWCKQRHAGTPYTRDEILDMCAKRCDADPVIEMCKSWEAEQKPAVAPPVEPKGPTKPSKEAQTAIPKAANQPVVTAPPKQDKNARMKALNDRVFRFGKPLSEAERAEPDELENELLVPARTA